MLLVISIVLLYSVSAGFIQRAVYNIDPTLTQPIVSLCNTDSVRVKPDGSIDLCLTINPAFEGKMAKSYTCESLRVSHIGGARFRVGDPNDPCILRMRAHANSVGVSISTPIEFTYWYGADPDGQYHSMGSLSIELKWAEQGVPFKAHQFELSQSSEISVNALGILPLLLLALS